MDDFRFLSGSRTGFRGEGPKFYAFVFPKRSAIELGETKELDRLTGSENSLAVIRIRTIWEVRSWLRVCLQNRSGCSVGGETDVMKVSEKQQ